jgi:hypothetical protein
MTVTIWKWKITIEIAPRDRYYEIIGGYSGLPIGWTTDPEAVLEEEPRATFREISKREYDKK